MSGTLLRINRSEHFGSAISAALTTKYGAGVTVHYTDTTNIVFACSAVCDKVIMLRLQKESYSDSEWMDKIYAYFGDAWTSGTTITNPVQFCGNSAVTSNINMTSTFSEINLILESTFLIIEGVGTSKHLAIVGKLSNNKYAVLGLQHNAINVNSHGYLTDNITAEAEIITTNSIFYGSTDGDLVLFPFALFQGALMLKNGDGTPATITGLYNVASRIQGTSSSFYASQCDFYNATLNKQLQTALFVPLT